MNNIISHLLGSSELSVGCSVSTCSRSAVGRGRRRGPAGRYRDSKYRYMLAATITEISPTSERILHSLLTRTLLIHSLVVGERNGEKQWPTVVVLFLLWGLTVADSFSYALLPSSGYQRERAVSRTHYIQLFRQWCLHIHKTVDSEFLLSINVSYTKNYLQEDENRPWNRRTANHLCYCYKKMLRWRHVPSYRHLILLITLLSYSNLKLLHFV